MALAVSEGAGRGSELCGNWRVATARGNATVRVSRVHLPPDPAARCRSCHRAKDDPKMPFVKLDCGILDSTLWFDRDARDVFLTALLMAVPYEVRESTPTI